MQVLPTVTQLQDAAVNTTTFQDRGHHMVDVLYCEAGEINEKNEVEEGSDS